MSRKPRMTGFARFFIALIFLAPLAYLGAAYFNGEDGLKNIKELIGLDGERRVNTTNDEGAASGDEVADLEEEIKFLNRRLKEMKTEIEELKNELEKKDELIQQLQNQ